MPPNAFQDWVELPGPWPAKMWFNQKQFSRVNKFGTAVEPIGLDFSSTDQALKSDVCEDRSHDGSQ